MVDEIFSELFSPISSSQVRGISLGMHTDKVISLDGEDYYEETLLNPNLQYLHLIPGFSSSKAEFVYYFNQERLISSISVFLAFNPTYFDLDKESFESITSKTLTFLSEQIGKPKLLKEKTKEGHHLEYSWELNYEDKPVSLTLMLYDEELDGNERVMKLIYR